MKTYTAGKKERRIYGDNKKIAVGNKTVCRICGGPLKLFKNSALLYGNGHMLKGDIYICRKCGKGWLVKEDGSNECF